MFERHVKKIRKEHKIGILPTNKPDYEEEISNCYGLRETRKSSVDNRLIEIENTWNNKDGS
jgi:hypothetical protein